ncbi:hypothetical protein ACHAWO_006380 [Cyclotella atomus]|uniref:Uncharacterized protein n=1 Tax=Cyclotella atomus TaxID=382360 RepID=A0ABD3N7Z1_9STRA
MLSDWPASFSVFIRVTSFLKSWLSPRAPKGNLPYPPSMNLLPEEHSCLWTHLTFVSAFGAKIEAWLLMVYLRGSSYDLHYRYFPRQLADFGLKYYHRPLSISLVLVILHAKPDKSWIHGFDFFVYYP